MLHVRGLPSLFGVGGTPTHTHTPCQSGIKHPMAKVYLVAYTCLVNLLAPPACAGVMQDPFSTLCRTPFRDSSGVVPHSVLKSMQLEGYMRRTWEPKGEPRLEIAALGPPLLRVLKGRLGQSSQAYSGDPKRVPKTQVSACAKGQSCV